MISRQINDGTAKVDNSERDELIEFINSITRYKSDNKTKWIEGSRNMIDLLELVKRYYYSPGTGGSNSLKQVLPAIIRDSKFLLEKYSKPGAYGKNLPVKSLNFDDHVWIQKEKKNDPYKTLPPVFDGMERETLDNLVNNFEGLADGGAAITAYSYLQYSHVPDDQKLMIADALYRYCELDTLAMVMLVEGWMNWGEKNKNL